MIEKSKVACFSGHRQLPQDCTELRVNLERAIISLIKQGVVFFGSGAALGFDQFASETVLKMKKNYPHIKLIMVLPCPPNEQSLKWSEEQRERYNRLLGQVDKVRVLSPGYTNNCSARLSSHGIISTSIIANLICNVYNF